MRLKGINHITVVVSHLETSICFYSDLLGMRLHARWDKGAYLTLGDLWYCLILGNPSPSDNYTHIAFDIESDQFDPFASKLKAKGIREWQPNSSEGHSIYILDPDDHKLEIHAGNINTRLNALKSNPYTGLIVYD